VNAKNILDPGMLLSLGVVMKLHNFTGRACLHLFFATFQERPRSLPDKAMLLRLTLRVIRIVIHINLFLTIWANHHEAKPVSASFRHTTWHIF